MGAGASSRNLPVDNSDAAVVLYTGPSFNGYSSKISPNQVASLAEGEVNDMKDVGFVDHGLMSMKVAPGYRVKLYTKLNREGNHVAIEGPQDVADMANFANNVSSMKVERVNKTNLQETSSKNIWVWILIIILIALVLWAVVSSSNKRKLNDFYNKLVY